MSITDATLPIADVDHDIVGSLLREQRSMTAVEQFSREHDAAASHPSAAPAQERYYRRLMPATAPGPGQQLAFEVELDACSGCKACVVACHTLNGLEEHETWRRVGTVIGESSIQHVTTACHHCEEPGCLSGCPVKAYVKDEVTGVVRHLDDQCIGCKYCTMMCPYEVPQYSERLGIVRKCDMCHQRLSVGEAPACVQACPNEAIRIRVVDQMTTTENSSGGSQPAASASADDFVSRLAPGAPDSSITHPTTVYLTDRINSIEAAIPQDADVDAVAESHWPLAVMLVASQAAIGLIMIERSVAVAATALGDVMPAAVTRTATVLALVIAGVGMSIAPLHLGQPLKAWRIFLGLRTSWLSREAVALGTFMMLLAAASALQWLPVFVGMTTADGQFFIPGWAATATLASSLPVGLVGFYASAMIYIATQRRMWRMQRTIFRFGGSLTCLGLIGFALAGTVASTPAVFVVPTALTALGAIAVKVAMETKTHYAVKGRQGTANDVARSARLVWGPLRGWVVARLSAAAGSALFLAAAVFMCLWPDAAASIASTPPTVAVCLALALSTSLAGEFAERLLYFSSVVYDRMPGTLR